MKSQNDLILAIVSAVIGIGCAVAFFFTKREPVAPPAPTTVTLTPVETPKVEPSMTNALSGGGTAAGGFGGFGGRAGGPPGMMGAPMGGGGGGRIGGGSKRGPMGAGG